MITTDIKYQVFSYDDFNQISFKNYIMENFTINSTHTLWVKFCFHGNSVIYMSGSQIGVPIKTSHNIDYYNNIYNIILFRLEDIVSRYDIDSLPDTIVLCHKSLNIQQPNSSVVESKDFISGQSVLKTLNGMDLNKSVFKKAEIKKIFSATYLPITMDISQFGFLLEGQLKSRYISQLIKSILNIGVNKILPEILSNKELIEQSTVLKQQIHLRLRKTTLEVLTINCSIKDYISLGKNINLNNFSQYDSLNDNGYIRFVYDLNSGICLCEVLDFKFDSSAAHLQDVFVRNINNFSLTIDKNKVIDVTQAIKLDCIKPPRFVSNTMSNPNIGVLDVETFINKQGLGQVYCLGYGSLNSLQSGDIKTYYLTDLGTSLNSDMLIITCINSMLKPKYNNYYWYIHNMGNFDIVYIYKTLEEFNLNSKEEYYKLKATYKDGKMLKLIVSCKSNKKVIKLTFLDSYNLLPSSLDTLTKDFNVNCLKGTFPYKFVNEKTINYIGKTPDIHYFTKISTSEYNESYSDNWSLKEESLKYLKTDILGLLEVLDKFKRILFIEHNLELTEGLTISRLALNKFLKSYLKGSKIPLINKLNIFNFIYLGYYGGRTEVFKPYGTNLYYYDINSLYPKVALNNMPGLNCYYKKSNTDEGLKLESSFGVFRAKVKTSNNYLGLLPVKTKYGLIFPIGEYEGVWPTPELKFATENGYEIKVLEGYGFDEVPSYFTNYVSDLYDLKSKTTGTKKLVNKSLLNNLLGRFGLNIIKPITKIFNLTKLDYLLSTNKVNSIQEITKDTMLVNYNPLVDINICMSHGVDYIKAITKNSNRNIENNIDLFQDVSVIVSALVTSYARVYMLKLMIDILKAGGKIYYTDTDSIITDISLDLVSPTLVGKELGKFKLEYEIKEGYFISNKTYCLVLKNGNTIIKSKGVKNESLTLNDFKSMYFSSKNVYATRKSTITKLYKGSVTIEDKKTLLQHDAYIKRDKIFNTQGLWIDTKPLIYNNLEKSIIPVN